MAGCCCFTEIIDMEPDILDAAGARKLTKVDGDIVFPDAV